MKNIKKLVAVAAVMIFGISTVGCNMIEKTPEAIAKTVVAKVGDKKITRGELDANFQTAQLVAQLKQQYGENYLQSKDAVSYLQQSKKSIIESMTTEEALIQEAEKLKVVPTEEELNKTVNQQIEDYKKSQNITDDAKLEEALKAQNITLAGLKDLIKRNAIIQKVQEAAFKTIKVEDKEIQDYYNKYKDKYPVKADDSTKLHLAHILVADEATAKKIKAEIDKGGDFAALAKQYGTDATKDKGGDLGTVTVVNSGFDEDFMNAAMQLKEGEVSGAIKTQFGYHIIKCIKRENKPVKTFAEAKEQVKATLEDSKKNEVWNKKIEEVKTNANIKIYEDKLV
ncbi:foldase protein PrsA 1 precursor [Clostridium homopropionicum DSM 5847]|uniref:peptidylprolyl isomerase n=1 Tax=Clostridium homopropionicum DSM 5847 TaxID=1121318 RepID=A0A0L6Z748_9CLOT|nr:peptidylprolyl isomerase [Clostridium homopropionicum]KOA18779.1 foldase protein PrsA 1 precursor [Clostridium homopropionicum DSM 5847]SFG77452.1 foldase protein PrsA [Clostridium homopropionicum]